MQNMSLIGNKTKEEFLEELNKVFTKEDYSKRIRPMTMEACVVRISDIIAYIGRDIEDAIIVGSVKRAEIPKNIIKILGNNNSKIVDTLIRDIIINSMNKPYLIFSTNIFEALEELKKWNYKYIYDSKEANKNEGLVKELFNKLFYIYLDKVNIHRKFENKKKAMTESEKILLGFVGSKINKESTEHEIKRKIIDFISGQTDKYFLKECEEYINNFKQNDMYE